MATKISHLVRKGLPALAYAGTTGSGSPGVIYCSGYLAFMEGFKALKMESLSKQRGLPFVRYDASGVGRSVDPKIPTDLSFYQWRDDLFTVIEELTEGPQVIVGVSMGVWLALLAAERYPSRVKGLLLMACNCDFFGGYFKSLSKDIQERLLRGETVMLPGPNGPVPANYKLVEEGKDCSILDRKEKLPIDCPIRILHGMQDQMVPYISSINIANKVRTQDVEIRLLKAGEHRLVEEKNVEAMEESFDDLLKAVKC